MTDQNATDFVEFLREETGACLRSVIRFDGQAHELAYVRDDVRDRYSEGDHERIVASLLAEAAARHEDEELYVHGELDCIVRSFERVIELHFPRSVYSGTAVALDKDAVDDLSGLIETILQRTAFEAP